MRSVCFPQPDTDKLWQGPYALLLNTLPRCYTYVRVWDTCKRRESGLTLGSEAQEMERILWEKGGRWSLEMQGEGLADLHGGRDQGSEGQSLAGLLTSRVVCSVVSFGAKFTVGNIHHYQTQQPLSNWIHQGIGRSEGRC